MLCERTKAIYLIMFMWYILASFTLHANAEAIVSINKNVSAIQGNTVTVPIMVYNVTNLGSGTINVNYDPSVVHVTSVTSGTGNALMVQAWSANNTIGLVKIVAWNAIAPVSGEVIFANVTYKAVGNAGESSPLNITVGDLTDYYNYTQIPYTLSNGTFTVFYKIPTTIDLKPETLNLKSKGVFTAFITLPEGYNVADIVINTVECEGAHAIKGIVDGDQYIAKFKIQDLVNVTTGDAVELTVSGELIDGSSYEGSDTVRVIAKGK